MEKLKIRGARRLVGEVRVSGAKNAALPILAASLLTAGDLELKNVPDLADVRTMLKLLAGMGVKVERSGSNVTLNAGAITSTEALRRCVLRSSHSARSRPASVLLG